jgi:hypothetical protein
MTAVAEEGGPLSREMVGAEEPAPLSAWRHDHTDERDRLAHERLQIVLEDRVYAKTHAEARRLIAEKAARAAATAHAT